MITYTANAGDSRATIGRKVATPNLHPHPDPSPNPDPNPNPNPEQVESLQTRVTALMRTTTKASHREAMLLQDRQAMQDQIAAAARRGSMNASRSTTSAGESGGGAGAGGGAGGGAGSGEAAVTVMAELAALHRCNAADLRDARNMRAAAEAEAEVAREQVPTPFDSPHLPSTASASNTSSNTASNTASNIFAAAAAAAAAAVTLLVAGSTAQAGGRPGAGDLDGRGDGEAFVAAVAISVGGSDAGVLVLPVGLRHGGVAWDRGMAHDVRARIVSCVRTKCTYGIVVLFVCSE